MNPNRSPQKKPKLLIVEDELITAQHLRRSLTRLGYEVVGVAASGSEALEQVERSEPDLLLADIGLQGDMDGIDVAACAHDRWRIPTVFLTAFGDPETMRRTKVTEAYGYLVKPFGEQELHATVEIALQQHQLATQREYMARAAVQILENTREELAAVTARLFSAQEEERKRIARDLHDDVGQRLALVDFDMEAIERLIPLEVRKSISGRFRAVRDRIGQLGEDLRELSHRLHPSILDDLGLPAALGELADEFQQRQSSLARFAVRDIPPDIPSDVSLALYRITQEALQNIAKHAGRAAVNISLIGDPHTLDLTIRDNGKGFDPHGIKSRGLGLISMAQRAELVGGNLDVVSEPGSGTQIHVRVPLLPSQQVT